MAHFDSDHKTSAVLNVHWPVGLQQRFQPAMDALGATRSAAKMHALRSAAQSSAMCPDMHRSNVRQGRNAEATVSVTTASPLIVAALNSLSKASNACFTPAERDALNLAAELVSRHTVQSLRSQ
jgi:hypothetical protein